MHIKDFKKLKALKNAKWTFIITFYSAFIKVLAKKASIFKNK